MLPAPCYVVGDTHLGVAPPDVEPALVAFLRSVPGRARSLVLNGDIFDFWFEWRSVMPRTGFRVISAIADICAAGIPVTWLGGNHDCWGGEFLRQDVGVDFRLAPIAGPVGRWTAHIEHGDGLRNAEDRTYRRLQSVLRARWAIRSFGWLHPDLASLLARSTSATSRHQSRGLTDGAGLRRVAFERLARDRATQLVVYGHAHEAELVRAPSGGVYANAGTWLTAPTFLRVDDDAISLRRWTGSGDGDRLDELERPAEKADRLP